MGEDAKEKGTPKLAGGLSPVSSRFIFVFALSQFSGPDYLGAWNRLHESEIKVHGNQRFFSSSPLRNSFSSLRFEY